MVFPLKSKGMTSRWPFECYEGGNAKVLPANRAQFFSAIGLKRDLRVNFVGKYFFDLHDAPRLVDEFSTYH